MIDVYVHPLGAEDFASPHSHERGDEKRCPYRLDAHKFAEGSDNLSRFHDGWLDGSPPSRLIVSADELTIVAFTVTYCPQWHKNSKSTNDQDQEREESPQ